MRLVQVGLGGWGRDWADHVVPHVPKVRAVAYVDADPAALRRRPAARRSRRVATYSDLAAALAAVPADGVLVTAPAVAHAPLTRQALAAGQPVLVEKPFATDLATARAVVADATRARQIVMVSQNYRFFPAPRTAARLVRERALGRVGHVRVDFRKWSNAEELGPRRFGLTHPLLFDMSIHHFDLMRLLLGCEPVRVFAQATDPSWSRYADEAAATCLVEFADGTTVSYRGSWVSTGAPTTWAGEWHVECADGEIEWTSRGDAGAADDRVRVRRLVTGRTRAVPLDAVRPTGRAGALAAFRDAVASGVEPETSGRDNLGSLALMVAAAESAATGKPQPVDTRR